MLLLDTSEKGDQLALLDVSGQPSVFASPVHYDIKLHRGTAEWRGFFNFMYFNNLSPEDQKKHLMQKHLNLSKVSQCPMACEPFTL